MATLSNIKLVPITSDEFPRLVHYAQDLINQLIRPNRVGNAEYSYTTGDKIEKRLKNRKSIWLIQKH